VIALLSIFVGSYLVGSIPVAYLLVWYKSNIDIRHAGSGNAGGFNAYIVTHSRGLGIVVGVLDALKGFLPVFVTGFLFPGSFLHACIALVGAVTGHNYPVWLGFKGGRGLATTAGALIPIGFAYTIVWCSIWLVARVLRRDILTSNLVSILATPTVLWLLPWGWLLRLTRVDVENWTFTFFSCILSMILLLSHLDAVRDVWKGPAVEKSDVSSPQP
jgi:acyl phosphate:glycerol-3-phosphate acyltransferase